MNLFARLKKGKASADQEPASTTEASGNDTVVGDRGIPSVNTRRRTPFMTKLLRGILMLAGVAMLFSGMYTVYRKFSPHSSGANDTPTQTQQANQAADQIRNTAPLDLGADAVPPLPDSPAVASVAAANPASSPAVPAVKPGPADMSDPTKPIQVAAGSRPTMQSGGQQSPMPADPSDRRLSKGMVYGGGSDDQPTLLGAAGSVLGGGAGGLLPVGSQGGQNGPNQLGQMLNSTKTATAVASTLPDDNFLLPGGTYIDCTANAAIDTTQPGMLNCYGDRDVWSKNGAVVLLDRGTQYRIEYQRGLQQGQNRIFFLAVDATTPSPYSVRVNLESPINDSLGRAGVDGYVDTHFWARFGGALMVGWIGDFGQAIANKTASNGSQLSFSQTTNSGSDAASKALEATVNIAPSLVKNQAAHLKIYVARDLDFRKVYGIANNN